MAIKTILVVRKDDRQSSLVADAVAKLQALVGEREDFILFSESNGSLFIYSNQDHSNADIEQVIRDLDVAGVLVGCSLVEVFDEKAYREYTVGPEKGLIPVAA